MAGTYGNILDQIGNTPLVPINRLNPYKRVQILAKLEFFNPGGSIKDRAALFMIEEAEKSGNLSKDKIIVEATSGNTGIGLALVAAVKGYRILLIMSESVSEERIKILKAMGAEIEFTPSHLSTDGAIEYVYNLVREAPDKYWLADQFNNDANWKAHYHGTALEIWNETRGNLDAVVATMGTSGTLMGLSKRFKELHSKAQIVGVEPYLGHKIQGLKNMKESYQPGIFDKKRLDRIIHIDDEEAFETARQLAKQEGIFVGMSSGAAMAAALKLAEDMPEGRIVTLLPDGGERYLSTPLFMVKKKSGLRIYNTMTREQEEFTPLEENRVNMYSCGPTLAQHIHLGQCRRFLFADLIRRYLEFKGYDVNFIMNITDLDDRTIHGADKAGLSVDDFTNQYYEAFLQDLDTLHIKPASNYPKASKHVDDMLELTLKLLEKGFAYEKFRSVYFDISRFKDYGKFSGIDLAKIRLGKTVDLDQYEKDNPRDFTLLKRSTLKELKKGIFYQTQWGNVRPSWHLECATIALKHLDSTYDIHTGGVDLIFPHHENETAISYAFKGKPLANYWIHNQMVIVNGKKPSGNAEQDALSLRDVLGRGFNGREVRYCLLSQHYRKLLHFSWSKMQTAKNTLSRLDQFVEKLHFCKSGPSNPEMDQIVYDLTHQFKESMDDDLNISPAFAALFQFTHRINKSMDRIGLSQSDRESVFHALGLVNSVLGVMRLEAPEVDQGVESLIKQRNQAREVKDWETADRLREELREQGIEVIDTPEGARWRRIGDKV